LINLRKKLNRNVPVMVVLNVVKGICTARPTATVFNPVNRVFLLGIKAAQYTLIARMIHAKLLNANGLRKTTYQCGFGLTLVK
jgi:hypothetical protein